MPTLEAGAQKCTSLLVHYRTTCSWIQVGHLARGFHTKQTKLHSEQNWRNDTRLPSSQCLEKCWRKSPNSSHRRTLFHGLLEEGWKNHSEEACRACILFPSSGNLWQFANWINWCLIPTGEPLEIIWRLWQLMILFASWKIYARTQTEWFNSHRLLQFDSCPRLRIMLIHFEKSIRK